MRKTLLSSLVRANSHALKPGRTASAHALPDLRTTFFSPCRSLAQVQSNREFFPEIWFTSSSPPLRAPEECGTRPENAPPDERTLKLGKSKVSRIPPEQITDTVSELQRSGSSNPAYRPYSPRLCLQRYCPLISPSTSSPPHTRTYPPSPAASAIMQLSGQLLWPGVASP